MESVANYMHSLCTTNKYLEFAQSLAGNSIDDKGVLVFRSKYYIKSPHAFQSDRKVPPFDETFAIQAHCGHYWVLWSVPEPISDCLSTAFAIECRTPPFSAIRSLMVRDSHR